MDNAAPPPVGSPPRRRRLRKFLLFGLIGLVLSVPLIRSAAFDWNDVPSKSMEPSILKGDRIVVNRMAYDVRLPFTSKVLLHRGDPQWGDLVVFSSPEDGKKQLKRVIGLPGDLLELRSDRLYRNGQPATYTTLDQPTIDAIDKQERLDYLFANEEMGGRSHPMMVGQGKATTPIGPLTVPAGHYWLLGDNRHNSRDSRYFGPVAREAIHGRAESVVFSLDRDQGSKPRYERFFSTLR